MPFAGKWSTRFNDDRRRDRNEPNRILKYANHIKYHAFGGLKKIDYKMGGDIFGDQDGLRRKNGPKKEYRQATIIDDILRLLKRWAMPSGLRRLGSFDLALIITSDEPNSYPLDDHKGYVVVCGCRAGKL